MEKRDLISQYNLPPEVRFCVRCTVSNQRPRITFDDHGVCSACHFADYKRHQIDWSQRERELIELCDRHRRSNGDYDVIVPCSGGKDGGYVAHQLKYQYGMNPLTVTWAPLKATDHGRRNLDAFISAGFDHVLGTPNTQVARKLTRLATQHLGDPFQPFIYGQTNYPLQMAVRHNVPLIMYGENGEVEYGGDMKNAMRPTREIQDHDKHYFSGLPPEFWLQHGVTDSDLRAFSAPSYESIVANRTEIHFFGYYKYWDPQENFSDLSSLASVARLRIRRMRFGTARSRARRAWRWSGDTTASFLVSTTRSFSTIAASTTRTSRKWSIAGAPTICGVGPTMAGSSSTPSGRRKPPPCHDPNEADSPS